MEHVYLNWKGKLEAKLTQCSSSSSMQPQAFIFKRKYSDPSDWQFEQIKVGLLSVHFSCAHNWHCMHWIHISLDALLEYASRQYRRKVSLEPPSFESLAFSDLFMFFGVCFVNISLEMLHTLPFPLFLGPVFLICSKTCVVFFCSIFEGGISQNGSCSRLLLYILTLSGSDFRKKSNVIWGRRMSFFLSLK